MNGSESDGRSSVRSTIEVAIPLLVIVGFIFWCLRLLWPFVPLLAWSGVTAVALYPLVRRLAARLGGRQKLAIAVIVGLGLTVLFVPVLMILGSLVDSAAGLANAAEQNALKVPPPPEDVAGWPVIGERVYKAWVAASSNLETFLVRYNEPAKKVLEAALGRVLSTGGGLLAFSVALLVAGALMANAEYAAGAFARLARRLAGDEEGDELLGLSIATVRTVATGVLGVAFIQAVAAGLGMLAFGIPAAGLIALGVLILAIAQLPPLLALLPAALWYFGIADSQLAAWAFLIFCILVNLSDIVLKPLLLGRGVNVPMLVVLLGAIGGLINSGIIGLFVGAVVLTLGYKLFQAWVAGGVDQVADRSSEAVESG